MPTIISMGAASARAFGFGGAAKAVVGQQAYTTAGTYSWVAPVGVTKVSVVTVGGGGVGANFCNGGCNYPLPGSGGGLGYKNNITVTPGTSYTVVVGPGTATSSYLTGGSYFCNTSFVAGNGGSQNGPGGNFVGDGGGSGGSAQAGGCGRGGGGAGGYSGRGGNGSFSNQPSTSGSGGGGGGGGTYGGGGGVGILGQGASGAAGDTIGGMIGVGGGGSGGAAGSQGGFAQGGGGGLYGGGSAAGGYGSATPRNGANGAVRIIWPGTSRQFPSTCTGDK